jgi:V8-like Glu-specific endopeptidase
VSCDRRRFRNAHLNFIGAFLWGLSLTGFGAGVQNLIASGVSTHLNLKLPGIAGGDAVYGRRTSMIPLTSVTKPVKPASVFESKASETAAREDTPPPPPPPAAEPSRSLKHLAVKGKGDAVPGRQRSVFESVIGVDERSRILDTNLHPWNMICALRMRGANGAGAIGTGWFAGPKTIITAGHCVHSMDFFGGWAMKIDVSPGRNGGEFGFGTVSSERFASVDRWVEKADPDFDIGCIHLEQPVAGITWFRVAAFTPAELERFLVNISGYPSDRGGGTEQYHHRNRVLRVSERRLFYDVDTVGGQSGAPVWVHETETGPPVVVGIHAYGTGGTPADFHLTANSAPRIIPEVLAKITEWVKEDGGWPT